MPNENGTKKVVQVIRDLVGDVVREAPRHRGGRGRPPIPGYQDRIQLQLRIGAKLIRNLDIAAEWLNFLHPDLPMPVSRTQIVVAAITRRLTDKSWRPGKTTAEVLIGQRTPVMFRVDRQLAAQVDADAGRLAISRTVWLLDAIIAELELIRKQVQGLDQQAEMPQQLTLESVA